MSEKSDAEEHLEDVLVVVQLLANEISLSDSLRPQLDTIVNKIPLEMMEKVRREMQINDVDEKISLIYLNLHPYSILFKGEAKKGCW